MPLVFVHGVNVRRGESQEEREAWDQMERARNAAFCSTAFADQLPSGAAMHFENPYWGDLASKFAWELSCIPTGQIESFGPQAVPKLWSGVLAYGDAAATVLPKTTSTRGGTYR